MLSPTDGSSETPGNAGDVLFRPVRMIRRSHAQPPAPRAAGLSRTVAAPRQATLAMNEQSRPEACERCQSPLEQPQFLIKIESLANPGRTMDVPLCEPCMRSMGRWLNRKEVGGAAPTAEPEDQPPKRRHSSKSRSVYADQLDQNVANVYNQQVFTTVFYVAAFLTSLVVLVLAVNFATTGVFAGRK